MRSFGIILILAPSMGYSQAILEHGMAAATGSLAGTIAGKSVSNALDRVLDATKAAERSSQPARDTQKPVAPDARLNQIRNTYGNLEPRPLTTHSAPVTRRPKVQPSPAQPTGPELPALPRLLADLHPTPAPAWGPQLTGDDLRQFEAGSERQEVVDKLGTPSSRISIPSGKGLEEILYFSSRGEVVGTVRVLNGRVIRVHVN